MGGDKNRGVFFLGTLSDHGAGHRYGHTHTWNTHYTNLWPVEMGLRWAPEYTYQLSLSRFSKGALSDTDSVSVSVCSTCFRFGVLLQERLAHLARHPRGV